MTETSDESEDEVLIFSTDDEKLKPLGKTLNNDYSRNILKLLRDVEMTANEIATKTGMSLPLVMHHLNTMSHAGIVVVARTKPNSKNQLMKYYTVKSGVLILPEKAAQKARESKSLSIALKRVMRFAGIGVAGLVSWMAVRAYQILLDSAKEMDLSIIITGEPPTDRGIPSTDPVGSLVISIIIPTAVIISGIVLELMLSRRFGKKIKKED